MKIDGPRIDIQVDEAAMQRARASLAHVRDGIARAVYNALNRTLTHARAKVARDIRGKVNLGVSDIKRRLLMRKAKLSDWQAVLGVGDAGFDLVKYFKATDIRPAGVRVAVLRGGSTLPRAFIAKAWGNQRVLMRMYGGGAATNIKGQRKGSRGVRMQSVTGKPTLNWKTGQITGSGSLVGRFPIITIKGPSLREIWEQTPELVARNVADSKQRLAIELDGQVRRLTKQNAIVPEVSG